MADVLKSWTMVVLSLAFVMLYGFALLGWLKSISDVSMIPRLEPIIFVIIGYCLGRLPAQQNERTLKDEIGRQTQKADAAQHAKERAQQSREAVEEKLKNLNAIFSTSTDPMVHKGFGENTRVSGGPTDEAAWRHNINAALKILNS
jgi:uncharacterized membrane protein YccC